MIHGKISIPDSLGIGLKVTRSNLSYLFLYLLTIISSLVHIHLLVQTIYTLCTNHQNISYILRLKNFEHIFILPQICSGYLVDATTVTECLHTFCKVIACLL